MTSPDRSAFTRIKQGLVLGASVERPLSRDPSSYILRYCVVPDSPKNQRSTLKDDVSGNSLQPHLSKSNVTTDPAIAVFQVMEVVRPFVRSYSDPPNRAGITSVQPNDKIGVLAKQVSMEPRSRNLSSDGMSPSQSQKGRNCTQPFSSNLSRKFFPESCSSSCAMVDARLVIRPSSTALQLDRKAGDNHDGSGFVKFVGHVETKARVRPWHQQADGEPIPMKYFMNGVKITSNPQDVIAEVVSSTSSTSVSAATATLKTNSLRPSLFSHRSHHADLHKSVQCLLAPERARMSSQAAMSFIQGKVDVWFAACQGDTDLVAAYIDAGVLVDALDRRYGRTPLQYAAGNNNVDIMRLLLQAGATLNSEGSRDKHSNTPLHFAALYGKTEAAHHLLNFGADCMGVNGHGLTPLQVALDNNNAEIAVLLQKYGAVLEPFEKSW